MIPGLRDRGRYWAAPEPSGAYHFPPAAWRQSGRKRWALRSST